eukprot:TRINITY_DN103613_c0_g1_i1.p1 TRINITY_DN103613_c0_g1~~TRINITY_DN103613_c0_g1_i1.p1  ORF type:complete len:274 (-),score=69.11 TRINITY_DN103613_c0_g1_i1:78-899(-)
MAMKKNMGVDRSRQAKEATEAFTGAIDSALRSSIAGLREEICRMAGPGTEEAEVSASCSRLQNLFLEKAAGRQIKFEKLMLEYIMRVPDCTFGDGLGVKPGSLMDALRTVHETEQQGPTGMSGSMLESDDDLTGFAVPPRRLGYSAVPEADEVADQELDRELEELSAALQKSLSTAKSLKAEAQELDKDLQVMSELGDSTNLRNSMKDLVQAVGNYKGNDMSYLDETATQAPKRRVAQPSSARQEEDDVTGLLGTPKRSRNCWIPDGAGRVLG